MYEVCLLYVGLQSNFPHGMAMFIPEAHLICEEPSPGP